MKILFVTSNLGYGGAEKQIVEMAKSLVAFGHGVTIYTLNELAPRRCDLAGSGVNLLTDQKKKLDFNVLGRLRAYVRKFQPDIVHGFLFDGNFYTRLATLGTRAVALNSERSSDYKLSLTQRVSNRLSRHLVDGVVANSHAGKTQAQEMFGLASEKVHVVWNGIDINSLKNRIRESTPRDYRNELFATQQIKIACLVGSVQPDKDYPLALRTAKKLIELDSSWRVIMVGGPHAGGENYETMIHEEHRRLGLGANVRLLGHRNDVAEDATDARGGSCNNVQHVSHGPILALHSVTDG